MYERLSSNTAKNKWLYSITFDIIASIQKINQINHDRKNSIEIFNNKLKKFLIDCDFTKPDKKGFDNLKKIDKYKNKQ